MPLPSDEYYEDYAQIENGVGMLRALSEEFAIELSMLDEADLPKEKRTVSIATGVAAYERIFALARLIEQKIPTLRVNVYKVINKFFGETVTVTGLLTGTDIGDALLGKELGDELLLSSSTLRAGGDLFLDDMTPDQLAEKLRVPIRFVDSDGAALVDAILGTDRETF
jgi:NifB/MoaA-like Fe-S oxidoreductase